MSKFIQYNPNLKERARELRKNSTLSEVLLWKKLKGRQLRGYDFHRQKPVGNYILDFFCAKLMLDVEIDGCSHYQNAKNDAKRDEDLNKMGIHVIHIPDSQVKKNIQGVIWEIEEWIDKH